VRPVVSPDGPEERYSVVSYNTLVRSVLCMKLGSGITEISGIFHVLVVVFSFINNLCFLNLIVFITNANNIV
jgi:hypothetical protein